MRITLLRCLISACLMLDESQCEAIVANITRRWFLYKCVVFIISVSYDSYLQFMIQKLALVIHGLNCDSITLLHKLKYVFPPSTAACYFLQKLLHT